MARILLSAYACEPGRGSEPGVGWLWATELARLGHDVTVLTRAANRQAIEACAANIPRALQFVYYDLPSSIQRLRRSYAKLPYYVLWQWFAARHIRRTFPSIPFDLVHHVTYVAARYPSFMGSLHIPFWFGPVSGGEAIPAPLRPGLSAGQRCREWFRDMSNGLVSLDPVMQITFRRAGRILVTRDTLRLLPRSCRDKSAVRLAVGLADDQLTGPVRRRKQISDEPRVLYVGRLLEWKGIELALRAVAQIWSRFPKIVFTIIGQGPARARLQRLCRHLDLDDAVRWAGWQPQRLLREQYQAADAMLFPSLRDSGGTAVLEALAHGVPVLTTDLGGPGVIVNQTCGRVIATAGRDCEQMVCALASAIVEVLDIPDVLDSLSRGARMRAQEFKFQKLVRDVYAGVAVSVGKAR